ncbi:MAG: tRNA lysidine(34) synthetase TilS, partial [Pseudomonadota bacterium]
LALLELVTPWARDRGEDTLALTVDHGLRPEAASEALFVADYCQSRGIPHRTLTWSPPAASITAARARRARHRLLASAVREAGANWLLLGHTRDDQAETVVMRQRAGATGPGLAGIRAATMSPIWPDGRGVSLFRPCLGVSRQALRDHLRAAGQSWIEDPTNADEGFERVRVRTDLAANHALRRAALVLADEVGTARHAQDVRIARWLQTQVRAGEDGLIACDPATLSIEDFAEALAHLLMAAAGTDRRAPRNARRALAAHLKGGRAGEAQTLGGAWAARRRGYIHIARDPGETPAFNQGQAGVWDGRFQIRLVTNHPQAADSKPDIRPLARPGYPGTASDQTAECLIAGRLRDIAAMLASPMNKL